MGISAHTTTEKMQAIASTTAVRPQFATQRKTFNAKKVVAVKRDVSVKADWAIGSPENVIVCVNTAACLFAGRFGLAPTVNKNYTGSDSYTMTEAERPVVRSRDPAGFTIVDVAAWGSLAHMISAGEILASTPRASSERMGVVSSAACVRVGRVVGVRA